MKTYTEEEGTLSEKTETDRRCPKCNGEMVYQIWESNDGSYEDSKYTCKQCGHVLWIDGIDS